MATWAVKRALPKKEGEGVDKYGPGVGSVAEAKRIAESDPQVVGFAHAVAKGCYFFKRVGTGFHRRTGWRTDDDGTKDWEWHYMPERVPKAKVLFLPAPMRGHVVPLMRLAEWFANSEDFEAHVWIGGKFADLAPKAAVLHDDFGAKEMDTWSDIMNEVFAQLMDSKDWYSSMAAMIVAALEEPHRAKAWTDVQVGGAKMIKALSPDLVIGDGSFGTGSDGAIAGLCEREGAAPFVQLECPAQPGFSMWAGIRLLLSNFSTISKIADAAKEKEKALLDETGPKSDRKDLPRILPSCEAVVRKAPADNEVCVGPFLPLPKVVGPEGSRQRSVLPEGAAWGAGGGGGSSSGLSTELRDWLLDSSESEPIVYVAFGTLVRLSEDFAGRLAAGLESGPWRVLWALPKDQQCALPERLRSSGRRWRLEAFAPQAEILGFARVRAFVSHCGQNSTQEALSYGVPMVCVPIYCDQFEWAETVCSRRGAGVQLDKLTATPEKVRQAVQKVLDDKSIRAKALACAEAMEAQCLSQEIKDEYEDPGGLAGLPAAVQVACETLEGTWKPRPPKPFLSGFIPLCGMCK